tara:strand:+ start:239 stop:421 length:183 start_codon:yes stop_codon:yes gene_type:complete
MTGTLTNKDIEILRNAKTSLSLDLSEKEFTLELDRIKFALNNLKNGVRIRKEDTIFTDED